MHILIYHIFLILFRAAVFVASLISNKARKWRKGRKDLFVWLQAAIPPNTPLLWMHCASLGEFEQGRPLAEKIRERYPHMKLLLTFFSPSGYEVRKNYSKADWVCYLPLDGPGNARRFLQIVQPALVIFVKYEFWYFYLKEINRRGIPLLLVSALFTPRSIFVKWYGSLHRKMLFFFTQLFVQNMQSKKIIEAAGQLHCTVAGDTRFDRVSEIAEQWKPVVPVEKFASGSRLIVAGSTWPQDEILIQKTLAHLNDLAWKLIIAPHEIDKDHLEKLRLLFPGAQLYSELEKNLQQPATGNCLIIDNIGMLSRLYKYGHVCYVGGGMRPGGLHNVLEAAVYGKPVFFGPHYQKFEEAKRLVRSGAGKPLIQETGNGVFFAQLLKNLFADNEHYMEDCRNAKKFVQDNRGASETILEYIQVNRLLTS